jgi:oligoendopeptidase F
VSTSTQPSRRYVPADLNGGDIGAVGALYRELQARPLPDRAALEAWIADWQELDAVASEAFRRAEVATTCNTANEAFEERYIRLLEELVPLMERSNFALQRRLLAAPAVAELDPGAYGVYLREVRARVDLFREENIPLLTEERKLAQEYNKIIGAEMVEFRGETQTMQQMAVFLEATDRATREAAWRARDAVRAADEAALDALYEQLLDVRRRIAANAGKQDYRAYAFADLLRFDYTPDDCLAFHAAIERHIVPVVRAFNARRARLLGVDSLRPWDLTVDAEGYPPVRPFSAVSELIAGCGRIFHGVDPQLGDFYDSMVRGDLLDLGSRPNKAPGGYMTDFPATGVPFIFMNAVGLKRDVDTLLHEGGHAFHYFLARDLPFRAYHDTGAEIAEVASQAMEYLSRPYLAEFYEADDLVRILDDQIRGSLSFFPFMAMIDAFQHWVYTTDDPSAAARRAKWADLEARFRPDVDWRGLETIRDSGWQYPHIFDVPFYYVEYGIALLAALRIWLNSLTDAPGAVAAYKRALALGGSRPLPDLFAAAGAHFGLDDRTVAGIVSQAVGQIVESRESRVESKQ